MKINRKGAGVIREQRRVLALEARTLAGLGRAVDARYAAAVRLLAACRGKVLVTGVGKSGFVAQKIAATLSSTGTPAIHLEPPEAIHGGLGLVQKGDELIAVGKCGESEELTA